MGWCSATEIFDKMADFVLNSTESNASQVEVLLTLAVALEDQDWDCQQDSHYWDNPIVKRVFRELHPEWFEDATL